MRLVRRSGRGRGRPSGSPSAPRTGISNGWDDFKAPVRARRGRHDPALLERERQRPLSVLVGGGRRRQGRAADRHRAGHLGVRLGAGTGRCQGSCATPTRSTSRPSPSSASSASLLICALIGARARRRRAGAALAAPADRRVALAGSDRRVRRVRGRGGARLVVGATCDPGGGPVDHRRRIATCERPRVRTRRRSRPRRGRARGGRWSARWRSPFRCPAAISIRSSQDSFNAGNLPQALDRAEDRRRAGSPGPRPRACRRRSCSSRTASSQEAQAMRRPKRSRREPANWRNWYVLARLDVPSRRRRRAAADATGSARELNPRSPLFAQDLATLAQ